MRELQDYLTHREPSVPVRIFETDKERFDALQQRLTVAAHGQPFSQGQVLRYLLDLAEGMEELYKNPFPGYNRNHK